MNLSPGTGKLCWGWPTLTNQLIIFLTLELPHHGADFGALPWIVGFVVLVCTNISLDSCKCTPIFGNQECAICKISIHKSTSFFQHVCSTHCNSELSVEYMFNSELSVEYMFNSELSVEYMFNSELSVGCMFRYLTSTDLLLYLRIQEVNDLFLAFA